MTIPVANVANSNTFEAWLITTNQLATALSTAVITTTVNANTAQTTGNAAIGGTFQANILNSNTALVNAVFSVGNTGSNVTINTTSIVVGNNTVNLTIKAPTAAQIANGSYLLNANGSYTPATLSAISVNVVNTSGTTTQNIDSVAISTYNACEYFVSVTDNLANNHYASKIVIMHDTVNPYITEYAQITSNTSVGVFTAAISTGNLLLQFTPISTNTSVRFSKVVL